MADGATIEQAIAEAQDAFEAWTMAERQDKGELPAPKAYSGQFVQRVLATRRSASYRRIPLNWSTKGAHLSDGQALVKR